MGQKVIMNNKIKENLNSKGFSVSKDFYNALNVRINVVLEEAQFRAKENGRVTVLPRDL